MTYLAHLARILMGIPLTMFGLMGLLVILPDPHAAWEEGNGFSPAATSLMLAMWDSGFIMPTVCVTHLVAGCLLLANRFVALALLIHFPVSVQMALFHLCLDPGTGFIAYIVCMLNVALVVVHRDSYRVLLTAKPSISKGASD